MVKTNKIKKRYITSLAYRSIQHFTITLEYTMSQMLNFYAKKKCITIFSADQQHHDKHFR
jgi:hypothetical protein